MATPTVVVDGSNIATEGRSLPSLAQLDEAVRAYMSENEGIEVLVVVDASFGYRIDESERKTFEEAEDAGEIISPPAGAIGRGDGFLLRIADRVDATVLSNDSFQEFHGEYKWLFDEGRLVGGKPVPGVGWIFTPRTPVRGPKSRIAVREAKKSAGGAATSGRRRKKPVSEPVASAIAEATAEAITPASAEEPIETSTDDGASRGSRRRTRGRPSPGTVNDPLPFISFIAEHHLGTEVEGMVDEFTSHGAFVVADGARCYVPLSGLGSPPPRSAKQVLARGEARMFVVQALDPPRRGIELALPELARVAGAPTDETVEAEIVAGVPAGVPAAGRGALARARSAEGDGGRDESPAEPVAVAGTPVKAVGKRAPRKVAAARAQSRPPAGKAAAGKARDKAVAEKAPADEPVARRSAGKKVAPRKAAAKTAPSRNAPPEASPALDEPAKDGAATTARTRKAAPKKASVTKSATKSVAAKATTIKKAAAKKAPAAKKAAATKAAESKAAKAPAKKRTAAKKATPPP